MPVWYTRFINFMGLIFQFPSEVNLNPALNDSIMALQWQLDSCIFTGMKVSSALEMYILTHGLCKAYAIYRKSHEMVDDFLFPMWV